MRYVLIILSFCFVSGDIFGQQESRFTQNMFAYDFVNPGHVGSSEMGDASLLMRSQNLGFKSSEGESLGANVLYGGVGLPVKKFNSGLGVSIYQHSFGLEQVLKGRLNYSYQLKVGEGKLGIGVYLGGAQIGLDTDKLDARDSNDPFLEEIKKTEKSIIFDLGLGLHYKVDRAFFGLSSTNLTESKLKTDSNKYKYFKRNFYLYGGYIYQTSNPMLKLKPSVFVRSAGAVSNMASLSLLGEYNNFVFGGVSYATNNDISLILGAEFKNGSKLDGVRLCGSWDFITNSLRKYSNGTFEISIGYAFLMSVEKATKTYKSVRFL